MRRFSRSTSISAGAIAVCAVFAILGTLQVPHAEAEPRVRPATAAPTASVATVDHGRFGKPLWVNPKANVTHAARAAKTPASRAAARLIARHPTAHWVVGSSETLTSDVAAVVRAAAATQSVATLVAYNIPHRDCGQYSANGTVTAAEYRAWVRAFVRGLGERRAIIIVEPDALGLLSCLGKQQQAERLSLLRYATTRFAAQGSWTYLDAGNSSWLPVATAASRLRRAGVAKATGFSLNVAQFRPTEESTRYGTELAERVGGKHFVLDTSRNGVEPTNTQWCNPKGRGLGHRPTSRTGVPLLDAYLWIKVPGESDGTCRNGPAAGRWFPSYATMLVRNAQL